MAYVGCIAGAIPIDDYRVGLARGRFRSRRDHRQRSRLERLRQECRAAIGLLLRRPAVRATGREGYAGSTLRPDEALQHQRLRRQREGLRRENVSELPAFASCEVSRMGLAGDLAQSCRRNARWRFQCTSSGWGKSVRRWTPRVSSARVPPRSSAGHGEHVLQFPAAGIGELPRQHVAAPAVDVLGRLEQLLAVARAHAGAAPHQALERVADVGQVQRLGAVLDAADSPAAARESRRASSAAAARRAFAGVRAVDQAFQQAVRRQPIGAVQAAGGALRPPPTGRAASCGLRGRPSRRPSCNAPRAAPESGRG